MQQAGSQHRVAKNAMWIIGGRVIQALLGLVVGALTARYLGPSNFGSINYAASLTAFIAPVLYLGLNATLVHELVTRERHEGEVLGTSLFLGSLASAVCFIGVCAFAFFVNASEQEIVIVCCLYAAGLLFQAADMLQYWFQKNLQSKYYAVATLIAYTAVSAYRVALLIAGRNVYWFALTAVIDHFIARWFCSFHTAARAGAAFGFHDGRQGNVYKKQALHHPGADGEHLCRNRQADAQMDARAGRLWGTTRRRSPSAGCPASCARRSLIRSAP